MAAYSRIPIPWRVRIQRWRYAVLPVVGFAACIIGTVWMWGRQLPQGTIVGEAEVVRLDVGAPADGRLVAFREPWALFEEVAARQVIARFDDTEARYELDAARCEVERLRKELEAVRAKALLEDSDRRVARLGELLRAIWESESRRLDVLDRSLALETARVELQRRSARLEYLASVLDTGGTNQLQYSDELLLHDKLQKQVADAAEALEEARQQRDEALRRLGEFPPIEDAPIAALSAPLQAAVAAQEARVKQIEARVAQLEVRAPIAGVITAIHRWPGQIVRQGDPLLTISARGSRYIVGYLRPEQPVDPQEGWAVEVRPRRPGAAAWRSQIEKVGPQVELLPEHHRRDPRTLEWGRPIRILLPPELPAVPGELFDVRFRPERTGKQAG